MTTFFIVTLSLLSAVGAVSVNTLIKNELSEPLQLSSARTNWGTFQTRPPQTIDAGGQGSWITVGSAINNVGFIEYDVYYNSTEFAGCVDVSYFWDLLIGVCNGGFEGCASDEDQDVAIGHGFASGAKAALARNATFVGKKTGVLAKSRKRGCTINYAQDCPKWGDPTFTLATVCK